MQKTQILLSPREHFSAKKEKMETWRKGEWPSVIKEPWAYNGISKKHQLFPRID